MASTNHERVGKALELLREGLIPYVERECQTALGKYWVSHVSADWRHDLSWPEDADLPNLDAALLLRIMWEQWNQVFRNTLGFAERSLVSELRDVRNKWAHQEPFSTDDAYRALDSVARLLAAVSAPQVEDIEKMKTELLRLRFDQQMRVEKRKTASTAIEGAVTSGLKPWREVVTPHPDVAGGLYQQAEFAADLWQVHLGEGSDEYRDPVEFFRRTHLTHSLKSMLVGAVRRLGAVGGVGPTADGQAGGEYSADTGGAAGTAGAEGRTTGGDPVVQLQTNFGGGKTHSMLALYHLFSGVRPSELEGIDTVMKEAGVSTLPSVRRVVLVGNRISPGNPVVKPDGTTVRTLWGELAWQLGGRQAYARIAADDERATSPGDALRALFQEYGPCLILIDEWVAYARQLHDQSDLPAGSFETQFTFAQLLTESAKLVKNCLVVISLPASDTGGSPHAQADDVEVGGSRGREALDRLRNVIGRVESSWRPAGAEEGFEIVRRRLFEPLTDPAQFKDRDVVARTFADLYRTQHHEFPPECRESDYQTRIKSAYPIHPEVFDRLYEDWSTLVKFQRTRGVLRLMAAVIHSLWEKGDRNPLILPANLSLDDPRVQFELTRYLSDNWVPVIEKDVDGSNSLPLRMDADIPNLGKYAACRRVARTIYLGSAPTAGAAHRGVEDRRVKLGCVMPGESPAVFGDALRRLAGAATYLYQDGSRYWYSTQPTVTKLAEDRAEQLTREPDKVAQEIESRLRKDLQKTGDFGRIHPLPRTSQDVPDDRDARLVVLGPDHPYSKDEGNPAELAAKTILATRGNTPRIYQNTLVFLAPDKTRLQDLDEAVRHYLAWESIVAETTSLDLSPHQVKQAQSRLAAADATVTARLPETYQWLLTPIQTTPQAIVEWQALRLSGQDPLAVRASKRLRNEELLLTGFSGTRLRMELDRVPLWRGDHVPVRQLAEDFARYVYLPRLRDPAVLTEAVVDGLKLLTWEVDTFAYADDFDESTDRYLGLRCGQIVPFVDADGPGLLVKPDVARRRMETLAPPAEQTLPPLAPDHARAPGSHGSPGVHAASELAEAHDTPAVSPPRRFHGSVVLETDRVGRDAGRIADEVISHLSGLVGAKVRVTLEVEAEVPAGVPEHVVRIVTENSRTLKFTSQGFETE